MTSRLFKTSIYFTSPVFLPRRCARFKDAASPAFGGCMGEKYLGAYIYIYTWGLPLYVIGCGALATWRPEVLQCGGKASQALQLSGKNILYRTHTPVSVKVTDNRFQLFSMKNSCPVFRQALQQYNMSNLLYKTCVPFSAKLYKYKIKLLFKAYVPFSAKRDSY